MFVCCYLKLIRTSKNEREKFPARAILFTKNRIFAKKSLKLLENSLQRLVVYGKIV